MPSHPTIEALAARFESGFREQLRPIRKIGKEAEYPVVWPDGRAGDVNRVLQALVSGGGFTPRYDDPETRRLLVDAERDGVLAAVEVGRGTIELSIAPCDDLWALQTEVERALALVRPAVESEGMALLGFGIQPRTPPTPSLMTPRRHYLAFHRAVGAPWLKLTTTAADQTHVDICRAELLDAINWMNLISGVIIALCANSSVYGGRPGRFLSGREGLLRDLGEFRYGMTPRRFKSVAEYVGYLCGYPCYVVKNATNFRRFGRPFTAYLDRSQGSEESEAVWEQFLWHEHYVWNSARARVKNSTIEMRPACQQPLGESLAANALSLGWVETLPQVADFLTDLLGPDPWPAMGRYRRAAVRQGLAAREPAPGLLAGLIDIAAAGLERRGRGEAALLQPIRERLERKASPAATAREVMRRGGMNALLARIMLPPRFEIH